MELRDPSMLARGMGANLTGSRADVVICDDVEVPRTCDTAPKREDLRARLSEIDYIIVPGGMQLYVGTPHTYYTIYADEARREIGESAPFLAGFQRLVKPILDDQGRSAWDNRFPLEAIERIKRATGPNKFNSQMMLRPVSIADGRLDPDRLRPYEAELEYREARGMPVLMLGGRRMVSATCWWDPAYGVHARQGMAAEGKTGDGSVVAALFSDGEGGYWLHRLRYLTAILGKEEDEASQQCRQVAEFLRDFHLPAVTLEVNGLGRFLPGLLRRELARTGVSATVLEAHSTVPKDRRIMEAFDAVLAAGRSMPIAASGTLLSCAKCANGVPRAGQGPRRRPGRRRRMPDRRTRPLRHWPRPSRHVDWRGAQATRAVTDFAVLKSRLSTSNRMFVNRSPFESRPGIRDGFFFVFKSRRKPMPEASGINLSWWITVVELPMLAALFWLIWHVRQESEEALDRVHHLSETALTQMRESLSAYKLEVAKTYVSVSYLKDIERRLTDHLLRIDAKLDGAALIQSERMGDRR